MNLGVKINFKYLIFQFLWVLIILPKPAQLFCLFLFLIPFLYNGKIYIDNTIVLLLIFVICYFLSIIINIPNFDVNRIIAAFNTLLIWCISILYYNYYKNNDINIEKIQKYTYINMMVLFALSSLFFLVNRFNLTYNFNVLNRVLYKPDWVMGRRTYRLMAYMEYSNLIVLFCVILFPLAYVYIKKNNWFLKRLIFIVLSPIPIYLSHSRIGFVLVGASIIIWIISTFYKNKYFKFYVFLLIIALCIVLFFNLDFIVLRIKKVLNFRAGSTITRMYIYKSTIEAIKNSTYILGIGIKAPITGVYLIGSHSSWISFIYKSGIIGFISIFLVFTNFFRRFLKLLDEKNFVYYFTSFLCLILLMFFEDIDGANWVLVLMFSVMGVYFNINFHEEH